MGLHFKDFKRKVVSSTFFGGDVYAAVEDAVREASAWADEHRIDVINV